MKLGITSESLALPPAAYTRGGYLKKYTIALRARAMKVPGGGLMIGDYRTVVGIGAHAGPAEEHFGAEARSIT
jgi:hypothetical protein